MASRIVYVLCPNCGTKRGVAVRDLHTTERVLFCESEDDGCDHYYAVKVYMHPVVTTFAMAPTEWAGDPNE